MYKYNATLVNVVDGDTVDLKVDLGFLAHMDIRFRLSGIDAPEKRGKSKEAGLAAKHFLIETLTDADSIQVESEKTGKFGRWLGIIYFNHSGISVSANELMITSGHAKPYNGGKRS